MLEQGGFKRGAGLWVLGSYDRGLKASVEVTKRFSAARTCVEHLVGASENYTIQATTNNRPTCH